MQVDSPEGEILVELRYYHQELAAAYPAALERLADDPDVAELHRFRAEHERHAARIDDVLFDSWPPEGVPDAAKSIVEERMRAIREAMDDVDAKRALLDAERACREAHDRALATDVLGLAAEALVRDHRDTEREHEHFLAWRTLALVGGGESSSGTPEEPPPELW